MELVTNKQRYDVQAAQGQRCSFCTEAALMRLSGNKNPDGQRYGVWLCEEHVNNLLSPYPSAEECWDLADRVLP